jgi:hypothetical protein
MVTIPNYPYNVSSLGVLVMGIYNASSTGSSSISTNSVVVTCNNLGEDNSGQGWDFQGQSNEIQWSLVGYGENYPFDSYTLAFGILQLQVPAKNTISGSLASNVTCTLTPVGSSAGYSGPNVFSLSRSWVNKYLTIPTTWNYVEWGTPGVTPPLFEINLNLYRTTNAVDDAILELLVPVIACYFLLATTLVMNPVCHLSDRLTVYLSLFVFGPTFLFAIQTYLPYRASLSLPELLSINLVISTTIFAIFSIVGNKRGRKDPRNNWDMISVALSVIVLVTTFYSTFYGIVEPADLFIFAYCVIPAFLAPVYTIWFPYETIKSVPIKQNNSLKSFFIGVAIMSTCNFLSLSFSTIIISFAGAALVGTVVGIYLDNKVKSALLCLIAGVVSAVLATFFVGLLGLTEVYNSLLVLGLWGYPIAITAAIAGIAGTILKSQYLSARKREKRGERKE